MKRVAAKFIQLFLPQEQEFHLEITAHLQIQKKMQQSQSKVMAMMIWMWL